MKLLKLFAAAAALLMASAASAEAATEVTAEDISGNTFLSQGLLFNTTTTTPKFAAKNSESEWNLPAGWIKENIINGAVENEGGTLVLSGDGSIKDYDCLASFNEHVHHVYLGGTCGNVLAINFIGTDLSSHLNTNYTLTDYPEKGFQSVWDSNGFNLFVVPDYNEMAQYAGKTLRVRMEINLYENDGAETLTFKAWGANDNGESDYDETLYAEAHKLKASEFLDANGKWDPTKWRAYEFELKVKDLPEDLTTWDYAPSSS